MTSDNISPQKRAYLEMQEQGKPDDVLQVIATATGIYGKRRQPGEVFSVKRKDWGSWMQLHAGAMPGQQPQAQPQISLSQLAAFQAAVNKQLQEAGVGAAPVQIPGLPESAEVPQLPPEAQEAVAKTVQATAAAAQTATVTETVTATTEAASTATAESTTEATATATAQPSGRRGKRGS